MTTVLLDTVGLIAIWDEDDPWHESAAFVFDRLLEEGRPLVVPVPILFECGNSAARRPYRLDVADLWQQMQAAGQLIEPSETDIATAWSAYRAGHAGGAGIVDQISFAIMRRLGLTEAFTNDRHFAAAGFKPLF